MRVLGVDPGSGITGWGIVEESGRDLRYVGSGVVRVRGQRAERLAAIHAALCAVCVRSGLAIVVLEQTFVGDNIQTAFRLGEVRGAVMVAAAGASVPVVEYSPAQIKVAVSGYGRASKTQMQTMVARLLGVDRALAVDEADALAAAICHLHTQRFSALAGDRAANGRAARNGGGWRMRSTRS
jgi:crossover junction endodeoxyribonuclease RuvC